MRGNKNLWPGGILDSFFEISVFFNNVSAEGFSCTCSRMLKEINLGIACNASDENYEIQGPVRVRIVLIH